MYQQAKPGELKYFQALTIILNAMYESHEHKAAVRRIPIFRCRTLKAVSGCAMARSLSRPSIAQSISVSSTSVMSVKSYYQSNKINNRDSHITQTAIGIPTGFPT